MKSNENDFSKGFFNDIFGFRIKNSKISKAYA